MFAFLEIRQALVLEDDSSSVPTLRTDEGEVSQAVV